MQLELTAQQRELRAELRRYFAGLVTPRSGKVFFRGVDLVARIESLDYWEGEP